MTVTLGLLNVCHDFKVEACRSGCVWQSFTLDMLGVTRVTYDISDAKFVKCQS
jgi:hypothetical protein